MRGNDKLHTAVDTARKFRERNNLTQSEFCSLFGLNLPTYKQWERGGRTPDAASLSYLRVIVRSPQMVADAIGSL